MIGGKGGRKIEALLPAEWLERRWRELRGLQLDKRGRNRLGRSVPVSENQIAIEEGEPVGRDD